MTGAGEREMQALRDEVDLVREQLSALKRAVFLDDACPLEYRLTASLRRVFGLLLIKGVCSRDAIMTALYFDRPGDEPDQDIVNAFIFKLRRKLRPFGVTIETKHGVGYVMPGASKAIVAEAMRAAPLQGGV